MAKTKLLILISMLIILISFNQIAYAIEYRYDDLGRLIEVVYGSGQIAEYTYDASGNILYVTTTESKVSRLKVNTELQQIAVGMEHNIAVTAISTNNESIDVTKEASYVSSNPNIATVTSNGVVEGVGLGIAIITVSYGGQSTKVNINIIDGDESILMIVGNPLKLTKGDEAIKKHLENRGFTVTLGDDNSNNSVNLENIQLIYISSSINEFNIKDKYKKANKAIVVSEPNVLRYMGMTDKLWGTHYGTKILQKQINITDTSHPVANGLEGTIVVQAKSDTFGWGVPGEKASIIATTKNNKKWAAIFTYEKGDELKDKSIATEKRVFVWLNNNTFSKVNDKGIEIFDRIIIWSLY